MQNWREGQVVHMREKTVCSILNKIKKTTVKYDKFDSHTSSIHSQPTSHNLPHHNSRKPPTETIPPKSSKTKQTRLSFTFPNDFSWVGPRLKAPIKNSARIWSQNISNIQTSHNFSSFLETLHSLSPYHISFLSFNETRLNPQNPYVFESMQAVSEMAYPASKTILTNTKLKNNHSLKQHGGSFSLTHGDLNSRFASKGVDRFGRYHYMQFYGKKHHLRI